MLWHALTCYEEFIQAWNLHENLEELCETPESIDILVRNPTMLAVQNWFNKFQVVANVANIFMDELE